MSGSRYHPISPSCKKQSKLPMQRTPHLLLQTQPRCRVLKSRTSMSETQFSEYKFRVDEVHGTQKKEGRYEVSHWVRIPAA